MRGDKKMPQYDMTGNSIQLGQVLDYEFELIWPLKDRKLNKKKVTLDGKVVVLQD